MSEQPQQRFTPLGKLVSFLLVAGLIALGVYMIRRGDTPSAGGGAAASQEGSERACASRRCRSRCRSCRRQGPVQIKDNIVPIEISEYAGYAGLIAANGGLEPTENSVFFKNHGFKVRLTVSEGENWSALNEGKLAASVTTADVLAVYGRQLHADRPRADWLLARRRRPRRAERHHAHQRAQGQDDCDRAVHRGRLLHPLPRAGSRPRRQRAWKSRQRPASRIA